MAFSPSVAKQRYKDLSIEELEKRHEELKKDYCFNTKEEEIDYIIKYYLNASSNTNINSTKIALEELLREKTGKEYKIEPKNFDITLIDIINFIADSTKNPSLIIRLTTFFQKLINISEEEKKKFLIGLIQDKNSFNEFIQKISQTTNIEDIYNKYKKAVETYVSMYSIIG